MSKTTVEQVSLEEKEVEGGKLVIIDAQTSVFRPEPVPEAKTKGRAKGKTKGS